MRTTIIRVITAAALGAAVLSGTAVLAEPQSGASHTAWPPDWHVWGSFATSEECRAAAPAIAAEEGWQAYTCSGRTLVYTY
ncbi:hypothetical protein GCM10027280_33330 [Micromonospora polyrhachis]|uniref:Alpha amylase inhibitor n=1 Tax=Micromonospora polyrhachis TaxID=1282883 RepID=A0A7W7SWG5_9ACTN|nr:hypothetical protein [Micromonospora polyrhachis]MBB4960930.1 hypothetical protein [Micromonospora polyrhachis]